MPAADTRAFQCTSGEPPRPRRRPGPFGPARILLPEGQVVQTIRDAEPVASALERLADSGYDQLPVLDSRGRVVGVFSWKSFGRRLSEIYSLDVDFNTLGVVHTELDQPQYLDPDTYVDTETDWKEIDYALVGSPDKLLGVLTLTDIYGRLNDFAEAFVLIFEIEHEIRDLFRDLYSPEELLLLMKELSDSSDEPESRAAEALQRLTEGDLAAELPPDAAKTISFAIGQMTKAARLKARSRTVKELEDFSFAQYGHFIFDADHWPRFAPVFNQPRQILQLDFNAINELRDAVFHIRRGIGPRDTDRLHRFRDRLRYDRDLLRRQPAGSGETLPITQLRPR
jgi:CBS domain-containing protein